MNEQLVNLLIAALAEQARVMQEQTAAISRLAESNEALVALLYQPQPEDIDITTIDSPEPVYLSGKRRG